MWRNIGILANLQRQTPSQEVKFQGSSLMVQWLWLCTPNAGGPDLIPGQGTRSHMPQLRPSTAKLIFLKSQVWIFCLKIDPRKPGRILGEGDRQNEGSQGRLHIMQITTVGSWSLIQGEIWRTSPRVIIPKGHVSTVMFIYQLPSDLGWRLLLMGKEKLIPQASGWHSRRGILSKPSPFSNSSPCVCACKLPLLSGTLYLFVHLILPVSSSQ